MLMEMPFVKTLVAAPFRCTQSEKTGVLQTVPVWVWVWLLELREGVWGWIRSQWKKVKAQAIIKLGPEGLLTWFFSNSFKEQPLFQRLHLSKITNVQWVTLVGLQGLAWYQLGGCRSMQRAVTEVHATREAQASRLWTWPPAAQKGVQSCGYSLANPGRASSGVWLEDSTAWGQYSGGGCFISPSSTPDIPPSSPDERKQYNLKFS